MRTFLNTHPIQLMKRRSLLILTRKTSYQKKRGSVGNSSPSTPIDVVNKPLPPLPTDKKRTTAIPQENIDNNSIANKTANHNSKLIEKKLQKMSLLQNRGKNLSSLLPRKKTFDDETSSVSSIVTTDSEPDFENEANSKEVVNFSCRITTLLV